MKRSRHPSLLSQQDWRFCFGAPRRSPLLPRTPFARASSRFPATCRCSSSTTSKGSDHCTHRKSPKEGNPLWLKVGSSFEPHPRFPRKEFHLVDAERGLLGLFDGIGGMLTFDSNIRGYSPSDFPQALLGSVRSRLKDWDPNAIDAFQKAANEQHATEEPIAKKNREEQEKSRESALRAMEEEILQKKQAKDASEEDLKLSAAWQQCVQQFKEVEDKRKEQRLTAALQSDSPSSGDMNLSKQVLLSAKRATQGQNVKGVSTAVLCMISSSAQMEDSSEATNEEETRNRNKERGVNARIWEMINRSGASSPSSVENEKKKEAKEKEESQQGPSLQLWGAWLGNSVLSVIRNNRIYFKSEPKYVEFDQPYCFSAEGEEEEETIKEVRTVSMRLKEKDVIVIASDGVYDNLYEREVLELIRQHLTRGADKSANEEERTNAAANAIVQRAKECSSDYQRKSPYAQRAEDELGGIYPGGKPDDITAIVAVVVRR